MSQGMIVTCPACTTRYVVPDSAVGVDGRVVRCAKCRHSWFQDGPDAVLARAQDGPVAEQSAQENPATDAVPAPLPPAPVAKPIERAPLPPVGIAAADPAASAFSHEPPFRPRRNPARLWMAAAIAFAVMSLAAITLVANFGLPDWLPLPRSTFAQAQPDLVLDFPRNRQERRPLPNGSDFFNVSGTILNVGKERRAVPTILIVLRDARNRIVYSLEAAPPRPVLAPGESETINQAIVDAPKSARAAEIGWKPR